MKHEWTPERREQQRALMVERKPWERSTGPKTPAGKAKASRNSRKHGLRSAPAKDIAKVRTAARRTDPETLRIFTLAKAALRGVK